MKRKMLWIAAVVVLIAVLLVVLIPRPLLGKDASVTSVYYKMEDITDEIDEEKLIEVLSDAKTTFSVRATGNYWMNDYPFEINMVTKGTSLHVVMGKRHYVYDRHWHLARNIKNGDVIYRELLELIK